MWLLGKKQKRVREKKKKKRKAEDIHIHSKAHSGGGELVGWITMLSNRVHIFYVHCIHV